MTPVMTPAQKRELLWLSERPKGGAFIDFWCRYPGDHFLALERYGYVVVRRTIHGSLSEKWVQLTYDGWEKVCRLRVRQR